jgi:hypothetical protein
VELVGLRNLNLRWDGEARNLSQQQREERQTVMTIIRQIEKMECKQKTTRAGDWSTGLAVRVGHASGKVGEKRRFGDACDTGWDEVVRNSPNGGKDNNFASMLPQSMWTQEKYFHCGCTTGKVAVTQPVPRGSPWSEPRTIHLVAHEKSVRRALTTSKEAGCRIRIQHLEAFA